MTATPQAPGALNWTLLLATSMIWGTAFIGMALALDGFGPLTVAAGRTSIGALALLAIGAATGQHVGHVPGPRGWLFAFLIGMSSVAIPFSLLAWSLQHVPTAFAGVAMGAVPLILLPLAYIFSPEEGIGPRRIAGVAMGFVGLALLVGPGATASTGSPLETAGRIGCLLAASGYAIGSVLTRRAPKMPPATLTGAFLAAASVVMLPLALIVEGVPHSPGWGAVAALVYVGLFPTGLAYLARVRIITTAGSLFMSLVAYLVPVWAVLFAVTLMGEDLPPQLFVALALILAGIGLSQWRTLAALARQLGVTR